MTNKIRIVIRLIPYLTLPIFAVSLYIWHQNGFIAMIDYYKDFVANIAVAILLIYLLIVEQKEKQLRIKLPATRNRTEQYELLRGRGVLGIENEYHKAKQEERKIESAYHYTKGEKDIVIFFLTGFTVLSAILAMISYFLH